MDSNSLFPFGILTLSLLVLFLLSHLLRRLIRKQIDQQMKEMIPIDAIRKRVAVRIKWRK